MRNVETLLWVRIPGAGKRRRCGKPTVRGAEFPWRDRVLIKRMPVAERQRESRAAGPGTPPEGRCITGRITGWCPCPKGR